MAGLLYAQGKLDEAAPLSREALEAKRATLGDRHPQTLDSMNNMASCCRPRAGSTRRRRCTARRSRRGSSLLELCSATLARLQRHTEVPSSTCASCVVCLHASAVRMWVCALGHLAGGAGGEYCACDLCVVMANAKRNLLFFKVPYVHSQRARP